MKNREWLKRLPMDLLMDIIGGLIYAVGLNSFANPNDIAPGGMSGVAVILNYLFDFPRGITIFCVNSPLLLLAWRFLGHDFTLHSLKTILVWSVLVDVVAPYLPAYAGDKILAALFGGVCIGIAVVLVFLRGSTTGGTDIVSRLLQRRWPFMPIGKMMIAVDAVIVAASMIVFKNIETGLYALISIFVAGSVIDTIMGGQNTGRMVLVVSDRYTEIAQDIIAQMGRGATLLNATGAYSGAERKVVLCAVRNNEYPRLRELIRQHDPQAFLITTNVNEVLGEGFASLNAKNLI